MKSSINEMVTLKRLTHDNVKREYFLYLPSSYSGKDKSPIVLNFHGFGGTAAGQLYYSDWRELSDKFGFILIYPQGLELQQGESHWNPDPISSDGKSTSNDLGFIRKLLKKISIKYSVDASRTYATGYSNGAGMAYGLAHHESELIAGIAPVSGLMSDQNLLTREAVFPVGLISFNGDQDWVRPVSGIEGYLASTFDTSLYWAQVNNSSRTQLKQFEQSSGDHVERTSYFRDDGSAAIEQYIINRGGHEWFDLNIAGKDLNHLAWDFLSKLSKEKGELIISHDNSFDIHIPDSFTRRVVDKITNFNPSTNTLEIDVDSFNIERSATFTSGKDTKSVKKKLAKYDFDFLYNEKNGGLYFNENGADNGFGDGGIIAILKGAPELTAENIDFV
jgi:polyhydroxybutyrate depolymerase